MPCRAVPCRAVPCRAVPCRAVPWPCPSLPCPVPSHTFEHLTASLPPNTPSCLAGRAHRRRHQPAGRACVPRRRHLCTPKSLGRAADAGLRAEVRAWPLQRGHGCTAAQPSGRSCKGGWPPQPPRFPFPSSLPLSMLFEVRTCFDPSLRIMQCPGSSQCSATKDQGLPDGRCVDQQRVGGWRHNAGCGSAGCLQTGPAEWLPPVRPCLPLQLNRGTCVRALLRRLKGKRKRKHWLKHYFKQEHDQQRGTCRRQRCRAGCGAGWRRGAGGPVTCGRPVDGMRRAQKPAQVSANCAWHIVRHCPAQQAGALGMPRNTHVRLQLLDEHRATSTCRKAWRITGAGRLPGCMLPLCAAGLLGSHRLLAGSQSNGVGQAVRLGAEPKGSERGGAQAGLPSCAAEN